jgi:hypothetical protein
MVNGCKSKDYIKGTTPMALKTLKNKCEPTFLPSSLARGKTESKSRGLGINKLREK